MNKCVPDSTYLKPTTVKPPAKFGEINRGKGNRQRTTTQESNMVVLAPDEAEPFPHSEAVNQALRSLANLMDGRRQSH